ncbi:hypothetical protein [Streptomyces sp. NPDC059649]|uniref:hypothetical protein n=1 Tax=Streptomyces sp. NPDC059649 TaxID=3346895 RepID=UPI00368C6C9F
MPEDAPARNRPTGAVIDIIERGPTTGSSLVLPNAVRINGVEVAMPEGARIQVHEISEDEPAKVTLTLFARRITIAAEGDI